MAGEHRFRLDTWAAWCEDTADTLERLAVELHKIDVEQRAASESVCPDTSNADAQRDLRPK